MTLRARLRNLLGPTLKKYPALWRGIIALDQDIERLRTSVAQYFPSVVRPEPRQLDVAITSHCNLRCVGCRYGREFMVGNQLPWPMVRDLLDDMRALDIFGVRFYGGEPLLHPDLPRMVEHAVGLGLQPYVTTNAIILEQKIDALHAAGLRSITVGFYGTGAKYDSYVQRKEQFTRMEAGIAAVRDRYGMDFDLRINWLLMRPSCNLSDLDAACHFAERYRIKMQVDLVHYSLPYFTEGPDRMLQFRPEDAPAVDVVVEELLRRKEANPTMFNQSLLGLCSIPDWLLKGPNMKVPCHSHQMLWVGADGTVQQCYVTFKLGSLHEKRLRDMLYTPCHRQAARDSAQVNCPNCHCGYDNRIQKHSPSVAKYTELLTITQRNIGAGRAAHGD